MSPEEGVAVMAGIVWDAKKTQNFSTIAHIGALQLHRMPRSALSFGMVLHPLLTLHFAQPVDHIKSTFMD